MWLSTVLCILPGLLDLASPVAANAIFALTAMALDLSYIVPIFLYVVLGMEYPAADLECRRRWYRNHPEVVFTPGPFYMGDGLLGWTANVTCIACVLSLKRMLCRVLKA